MTGRHKELKNLLGLITLENLSKPLAKNINEEGKYVTTTITSVTTVSIDASGKIDKDNVSKSVTVHAEISDGKGDIEYKNTTASATVKFDDVSPALQTTSTSAATEKDESGYSPLQKIADNINFGISVTAGAVVGVATGGTSKVVQFAAGIAVSFATDRVLPKITAEQVTKELYYKQEVLK